MTPNQLHEARTAYITALRNLEAIEQQAIQTQAPTDWDAYYKAEQVLFTARDAYLEADIRLDLNTPDLAPVQTDDIVTRLEKWARATEYGEFTVRHDTLSAGLLAAADEIRRLQAALAKAELAEDDDRRARERVNATFEGYVRITDEQIAALKADAENARGEVEVLREVITPRVEVKAITDPKTDETREYQWMVYTPQFMPHWSGFEARETWAREEAQKIIDSGKLPTLTKPA